ncbi:MAG: hypothetical protein ACFFCB_08885 [Candidatus Odinarchaeota archaeon]
MIKAPGDKPSITIQTKSEDWAESKLNRRLVQDRVRKVQEFIKKNWRLRLLFERGRIDPLFTALRKETQATTSTQVPSESKSEPKKKSSKKPR